MVVCPVSPLYIQRCNHDRSATQNLTPISRCFKYIFSHFYPYFAQNVYKLAFKKYSYCSHSKYTFTKTPLFSQFQVHFYVWVKNRKTPLFQFRVQAQKHPFFDFEYKLMKTTLFFKIANMLRKHPFLREILNDHA